MGIDRKSVRSRAQKQMRKGNWSRAIDAYEKLADDDPSDDRSRLKLADLYTRVGEEAKAVESYRAVGNHHADDDLYQKAVAVYKQAIRLDDSDPELHRKVGEAYHRLDRLKDAAQALRRAQERYKAAGNREEQLEVLEELVRLDPEDVGLHIQLAETYAKQDRDDDALQRFRKAAEMLEEEGRVDDYTQVAERIVYFDPDDMEVRRRATDIYCGRNDHKRALKHLQVLFNHDPEDEETLRRLAETFMELDRTEKATLVFQKLANYYEGRDRADSARQTWTRILDIDPTNEAAQQALQRLGDESPPEQRGRREPASGESTRPAQEADEKTDDGEDDALEGVEFLDDEPDDAAPPESPPDRSGGGASDEEWEERSTEPSGGFDETGPSGQDAPGEGLKDVSDQLEPVDPRDDASAADPELEEMVEEVGVFIKYELFDKARDLIAEILERAPNHLPAYEKRRELYAAMGNTQAEASTLVDMARLYTDDRRRARKYLDEAADLGASEDEVDAAARELGIDRESSTAPPSDPPEGPRTESPKTPPPSGPDTDERTAADPVDDEVEPVGEEEIEFVEVTPENAGDGGSFDGFDDGDFQEGFVEETEVLDEGESLEGSEELEAVGEFDDPSPTDDFQQVPDTNPTQEPVDHAETEIDDEDEISFSDEDLEGAFDSLFEGAGSREQKTQSERLDEIDSLIEAGRVEEAEASLRSFEQEHPNHPGIEERYRRIEGSGPSRRDFDQPPTGARSLSGEFQAIGPKDESESEEGEEFDADVMHSSLELGISYREMEMYDEAIREFQEAIQDPEAAPAAKYHIAICKAEKGNLDEAADDLSRLLRHDQLPGNLREAARDKLDALE